MVKTAGVSDIVRSALKKHVEHIDLAFIYGSMARNEELSSSDVDLMVIGSLGLGDIAVNLKKAEKVLGREVNLTIYSRKEFIQKLKEMDGFIKTIMAGKKIFIKGDENE